MCGIAGIWNRDDRPVDPLRLARMRAALRHRGPDAEGTLLDGSLGFGHCRLSIMDPSPCSDQPLSTPDGRFVLSFNGEIHNYLEIRETLQQLGYRFRTRGDSEVLLWAYHRWGRDCLNRFNGMWAFVIWDRQRRRLLLSRDRFGIKPLYYSVQGSRIAFASEIKALLAAFPEEAAIDESELGHFLLGANPDSGACTFYRDIRAVPPATSLTFTLEGEQEPRSYWDFEPGVTARQNDAVETFRDLFEDAVRIRLRSDTPVGACVSGGLDSGAIGVTAAAMSDRPCHCFSLEYPDHLEVDESHYARQVLDTSQRFIRHWVRPQPTQLLEKMDRIVRANDAPCPARGRLAMWEIFREAQRHVKVVLIGEGSDELLGGYQRFLVPWLIDLFRLGTRKGRRALPILQELRHLATNVMSQRVATSLEYLRPLRYRRRPYNRRDVSALNREFLRLAAPPPATHFIYSFLRTGRPHPFPSALNNALWQEFRFSGLPELLRAEDALSMDVSLETRAPFLDHRLVEFCFRLPHFEKIGEGWTKHLLRRAMQDRLPDGVRFRRQKMGLPIPYSSYFRDPDTLRRLPEILLDGRAVRQGFLLRPALERQLSLLRDGRRGPSLSALWRYAATEIWLGHLAEWASSSTDRGRRPAPSGLDCTGARH